MKLKSVRVRHFRNIIDSGEVLIEDDVTCLVGKNESGKTAFLHALHRLNPARSTVSFSSPDDYPAWLEKRHRQEGKDLEDEEPITATFALDGSEREMLESTFGTGCITNAGDLTVSRKYDGALVSDLQVAEDVFVRHIVNSTEWPHGTKGGASNSKTISGLREHCESLTGDSTPEYAETGQAVLDRLKEILGEPDSLPEAVLREVITFLPKFLYFDDYSRLPYSVPIARVLTANDLDESELTARALLRLAAAEDDYLQNPDYERRKRELENVANAITDDVLKYWSQNPELRVQPDITQRTVSAGGGEQSVLDELKIRIWDNRHLLSLPFSDHSTGFQWFFSFLAAFSEYEYDSDPVVLLLDEPALGLHARAQADFLRFIDKRLAPKRQVLYTTHSPFMIEPGRLERVRLVEDKGKEAGSVITSEVTSTDPDTLFPLQGALGYDLVQHLFIAPNNLVVEGTSDFTYLRVISDHLEAQSRTHLDPRWSIVPVGGADLIPTFVALLGNHLDVTVLVDGKKGQHQKLERLAEAGVLTDSRIITISEIKGGNDADVEDLFVVTDYLSIFNPALAATFAESDIQSQEPIVRQLARLLGVDRFNHGLPADYLLRNRDKVLPALSDETLDNFERLFERVNATLPSHS